MPELLSSTAADSELPDAVHDRLDRLRGANLPAFELALEVRAFVRQRYRYDPTYMEDPAVARWLRDLSRGRRAPDLRAVLAWLSFDVAAIPADRLRRFSATARSKLGTARS